MRKRSALAAVVACIGVLAIAGSAQASTCTYQNGVVVVNMPGALDGVSLHRVGPAIYNGGQWCGGTVDNTSIITVNDTTPNKNGDDLVDIDLSGGPLAPETGDEEAGGGVSEIEIYLFTYQGTNTVVVTGSDGADNIHAGMAPEGGVNARAINLNAGAEQGKV
jgi:hypothetical protein